MILQLSEVLRVPLRERNDLTLHPRGMQPLVRNWRQTATVLLTRLQREVDASPANARLRTLFSDLCALPGIPRPLGVLWLAAAVSLLAAVALLFAAPRWFWLVGLAGLVASQIATIASWGDARFGTITNLVLLAAVIYGAFAWGPFGLHAYGEVDASMRVRLLSMFPVVDSQARR